MSLKKNASEIDSSSVELSFHGYLPQLLSRTFRGQSDLLYELERKTSIKDLIESLGVPHTEIDRIIVNNANKVDFSYIVMPADRIKVYPVSSQTDFFSPSRIRPALPHGFKFMCDVNVGKLARWLRIFGFDTVYENNFEDDELAEMASKTQRILLSKDCNLLKRKKVIWGHLVRVNDPIEQIVDVVQLFQLERLIQPYRRCLRCNGQLLRVEKEKVDHLLEPLTRKYYTVFHQCNTCCQVYWQGSHRSGMEANLQAVLGMCRGAKTIMKE
jgi:uncharacterized protein with PIN domain